MNLQNELPLELLETSQPAFVADAFFESAVSVIQQHYLDATFGALAVACSFGKDSTATVILAIEAIKRLAEQEKANKPLLILTSDTRVENPLVARLVQKEQDKIHAYAKAHGLPITCLVGRPSIASSWAVKLIAGQGIAPVPGGQSWCTQDWKISPMQRVLAEWCKNNGVEDEVLKLTGTRFQESSQRGQKMTERGESSTTFTRNKAGEAILSPIADLSSDEVWELLGLVKAGQLPGGYSDFDELFEVYIKAGGTSCVVVADDRLSKQDRGECSARTGCAMCTKVTRDESLENMLEDHPEMKPLHQIREWLAAITFDWSKRNWIGRTINEGYITIAPDAYSVEVTYDLLRFCLSADANEQARAEAKGEAPLFQLIPLEALIAIDFYWSLHGQAPAYEAWRIYFDVVNDGNRYVPPHVDPVPRSTPPAPRYLHVGGGWLDGEGDGCTYRYSGLRDPLAEALEADTGADYALRTLKDGRELLDLERLPGMQVDLESIDTWDFLQFMLEDEIDKVDRYDRHSSVAARTYLQYGVVKYGNHGVIDHMLKRVAFRENNGIARNADLDLLMERTISADEFRALSGAEQIIETAPVLI